MKLKQLITDDDIRQRQRRNAVAFSMLYHPDRIYDMWENLIRMAYCAAT